MLRGILVAVLRKAASGLKLIAAPVRRLRRHEPAAQLVAFRGFGSRRSLCFVGRVSEAMGVDEGDHTLDRRRRILHRLRDAYRLLISRPVPNARIEIRYGDHRWQTKTDEDGLFFCCFAVDDPPLDPQWQGYQARLLEPALEQDPQGADGELFMLPATAERVIISDLDDTVIFTGVANKLLMLWRLFATSAQERSPFPGVAAFYRGLHAGGSEDQHNPVIYVSRSPWSIYPTLEEFFHAHRIPAGPILLLRDWGITYRHPLPRRAPEHKQEMIHAVLDAYPDLPAVLVGDSGQRDPEIYAEIADRYPQRVAAIYIRDLQESDSRSRELAAMAERSRRRGVDFVSAPDTAGLAADAAGRGWISAAAQQEVSAAAAGGEV